MLQKNSPVRFVFIFVSLFTLFYYFNIGFLGITSPGGHYSPFLAEQLNYIQWLRAVLLHASSFVLNSIGVVTIINEYQLLAAGHRVIFIAYSCLGFGVMSFFAAFIIAYPKPLKSKLLFFIAGILIIQLLNVLRFVLLALYWPKGAAQVIDHHTIFNIVIYILISISLYFWVTADERATKKHAKN